MTVFATSALHAEGASRMTRIDFESAAAGSLPPGLQPMLTGGGGPVAWTVIEDPTAPAGAKVLAQTSTDRTASRSGPRPTASPTSTT
jgi:hypothetical protein